MYFNTFKLTQTTTTKNFVFTIFTTLITIYIKNYGWKTMIKANCWN